MQEQKKKERMEIIAILLMALAVFLTLCNIGVAGSLGSTVKGIMFGIFGVMAYVLPFLLALGFLVYLANKGNRRVTKKVILIGLFLYALSMLIELFGVELKEIPKNWFLGLYNASADGYRGGGLLAGMPTLLLYHYMNTAGTVLVIVVIMLICIVFLTEKSIVNLLKRGSEKAYNGAVLSAEKHRNRAEFRPEEIQEESVPQNTDSERSEKRKRRIGNSGSENTVGAATFRETGAGMEADVPDEKPARRMDRKVSGVSRDTLLVNQESKRTTVYGDNLHEITLEDVVDGDTDTDNGVERMTESAQGQAHRSVESVAEDVSFSYDTSFIPEPKGMVAPAARKPSEVESLPDPFRSDLHNQDPAREERRNAILSGQEKSGNTSHESASYAGKTEAAPVVAQSVGKRPADRYKLPTLNLLKPAENGNRGDSAAELKETAAKLLQTLEIFGVRAKITDISKGPSVTRYELQPELGVKVSKIVSLADDLKLQLAATDIRIEAPIPGKSAVGIEVPNKVNTMVRFRELVEAPEFRNSSSLLSFAVGKDLSGQVVVWDIAKMPHVLIAGTTGSGKSVCMNTLIMSILYKANPEDVKFIMVDPKQVEFSIYNGIPHLLLPVVTDPKQAAGALNWGVEEMTRRYKLFADLNVKDIGHYNAKVAEMKQRGEQPPAKLPQIVIVVDELADLMMVAQASVEQSICRLAQLARAAGIHLVIATQRPSVDVVTGLIKANMPSRIACKLASGTDSRTILDMSGAEKLLGNGDMLFFPNGASKPVRVQGAFLSDKEVGAVVDYIKSQDIMVTAQEELTAKVNSFGESGGSGGGGTSAAEEEYDAFFVDAGRVIIKKDKASIGMLQREFRIGFNRAARIMDQLCEAGVVGEEEGTKPRNVLMSMEEFDQYVEQNL